MVKWVEGKCDICGKNELCRYRKPLGKPPTMRCPACTTLALSDDTDAQRSDPKEVQKKNIDDIVIEDVTNLEVGDRVRLKTGEFGIVAFIGPVADKSGEFLGLALDKPEGLNDGTVNGEVYFKVQPKHGMFVRIAELSQKLPKEKVYVILSVPDPKGSSEPAYVFMTPEGDPRYMLRSFLSVSKMYAFKHGLDEAPELIFCVRGLSNLVCLGDSPKADAIGKLKKLPEQYCLAPGTVHLDVDNGRGRKLIFFGTEDYFETRSACSIRDKKSKSELEIGWYKLNMGGSRVLPANREPTEAHISVDFNDKFKDAMAHFLVLGNFGIVMDQVKGKEREGAYSNLEAAGGVIQSASIAAIVALRVAEIISVLA
jgi:hypothetical protein